MDLLFFSQGILQLSVGKDSSINQKEIRIMRSLGLLLKDPCPLEIQDTCNTCSGYYKMVSVLRKYKINSKQVTVTLPATAKDGEKCKYRMINIRRRNAKVHDEVISPDR